jgi:NitT/TauT family transport system permease protein/taurine transport system permease protein
VNAVKNILNVLISVAGVLLVWLTLTTWTGIIEPNRFPNPMEFWVSLKQIALTGYGNGRLHQHVLQSVILVTTSFLVASAAGVTLGLLMGASRRIEAFVNPVFLTLRPIPPLAWIPLAIVWLGLDNSAKVMVIFVAAFVPSVINSYAAVRSIETPILEASAMLGIRRWLHWKEVLIPASLPLIFTGLRLSLQASWTTLVAAELIGALLGLGSILNQAAQDIYPAMILVGMVSVAICGWLMTVLLGVIERRAMPWRATP